MDELPEEPKFTSSNFMQSAPTNASDIYIRITEAVLSYRDGIVDSIALDDIHTLWEKYRHCIKDISE